MKRKEIDYMHRDDVFAIVIGLFAEMCGAVIILDETSFGAELALGVILATLGMIELCTGIRRDQARKESRKRKER